ncbi:polyamine ABC transporter substrate-binding protein [Calothrix sp. 336/3]|uniref:polyamine ABC transporter substrate-binding protein n=1 Tax=Calothrix sp. 336/3 TaxID=1337936 RepID=UPI0004E370E2|nr:spermidine/putrescine ABC transporter substrate-binding protein [Calothrix sp. 336/3]AKG23383.1 polyamine ABC transporter substrate-binding protein [Calothrix sp. 336/3]
MITRRKLLTGVVAASSLSLTSCGWKLANVRATSNLQGVRDKLYIYTWEQYTNQELLKNFSTESGIKIFADVLDSNETMLNKVQAGGGSAYSVIYPSDYAVRKMVNLDLLAEINHEKIQGLDNLLPVFQNPSYDPNNRHSIPFSWGTTGFIFNSEKLPNPPDSWEYLWQNQDKLNRQITLMNDTREVFGGVLKMLGYSYNSLQESEIKQAYEKLKILKPAIATFTTDAWKNQLLSGDLLIAMCYSVDAVKIAAENPRFKYVIPKTGSSLWTDTLVIPKTAPNPDGAYAWINWILEPRTAAEITKNLGVATPNAATFAQLPTKLQNNQMLFPSDEIVQKCERISPIDKKIQEIYERYWNELTSS